jgi:hypothetical protein
VILEPHWRTGRRLEAHVVGRDDETADGRWDGLRQDNRVRRGAALVIGFMLRTKLLGFL